MRIYLIIEFLMVTLIIGALITICYFNYENNNKTTITLKKEDWQCTKYQTNNNLQPMGRILMPISKKTCIEYRYIND